MHIACDWTLRIMQAQFGIQMWKLIRQARGGLALRISVYTVHAMQYACTTFSVHQWQ